MLPIVLKVQVCDARDDEMGITAWLAEIVTIPLHGNLAETGFHITFVARLFLAG